MISIPIQGFSCVPCGLLEAQLRYTYSHTLPLIWLTRTESTDAMANVLDPKKVTDIAKMHGYQNLQLGEKEQQYMLTFKSEPISGSGNAGIIGDAVKVSVWFTTGCKW